MNRFAKLKAKAEQVKVAYNTHNHASCSLDEIYNGDYSIEFDIEKQFWDDLINKVVCRCKESIFNGLKKANLTSKDITKVIMIGGTCQIPQISTLIEEIFGKNKLVHSESIGKQQAVASGACIEAYRIKNHGDYYILDDIKEACEVIGLLQGKKYANNKESQNIEGINKSNNTSNNQNKTQSNSNKENNESIGITPINKRNGRGFRRNICLDGEQNNKEQNVQEGSSVVEKSKYSVVSKSNENNDSITSNGKDLCSNKDIKKKRPSSYGYMKESGDKNIFTKNQKNFLLDNNDKKYITDEKDTIDVNKEQENVKETKRQKRGSVLEIARNFDGSTTKEDNGTNNKNVLSKYNYRVNKNRPSTDLFSEENSKRVVYTKNQREFLVNNDIGKDSNDANQKDKIPNKSDEQSHKVKNDPAFMTFEERRCLMLQCAKQQNDNNSNTSNVGFKPSNKVIQIGANIDRIFQIQPPSNK